MRRRLLVEAGVLRGARERGTRPQGPPRAVGGRDRVEPPRALVEPLETIIHGEDLRRGEAHDDAVPGRVGLHVEPVPEIESPRHLPAQPQGRILRNVEDEDRLHLLVAHDVGDLHFHRREPRDAAHGLDDGGRGHPLAARPPAPQEVPGSEKSQDGQDGR